MENKMKNYLKKVILTLENISGGKRFKRTNRRSEN